MRRIILIMVAILICAGSASADRRIYSVESATNETVFNVPSTNTLYTKAFWIKRQGDVDMGVMYKVTNAGTIDINIDFEQGYTYPATEGSASDYFKVTNHVDTELVDQLWHLATVDSVAMPVGRFKVTGEGSNDVDTMLQIKVGKE